MGSAVTKEHQLCPSAEKNGAAVTKEHQLCPSAEKNGVSGNKKALIVPVSRKNVDSVTKRAPFESISANIPSKGSQESSQNFYLMRTFIYLSPFKKELKL
jgi:hypothetical protein